MNKFLSNFDDTTEAADAAILDPTRPARNKIDEWTVRMGDEPHTSEVLRECGLL